MSRKQNTRAAEAVPQDRGGFFRRLLLGRATVAEVVVLLAIAAVIGVSASFLVYRAMGPTPPVAGPDPAGPWRARLLQNPKDVEALLGLAHVQLDQQQPDAAESLYREVLALQPKNVEAITHLGTVLLGRGQVDAALAHYDQALAIDARYLHALWDKASLLQQVKQDYRAAVHVWEAFIDLVGADSHDGKTAQNFIAEARKAMGGLSPVEKAFGGKS